jgi:uncharacterized small protein (DUF1192 family)
MNMKQLTLRSFAAVLAIIATLSLPVLGAFAATSPKQACGHDISCIKQKGDQKIQERLDALQQLISRAQANKTITTDEHNDIVNNINEATKGLNQLKTKLDGETTEAAARQDYHDIFAQYYIFWIALPRERHQLLLDDMAQISAKLQSAEGNLQSAIDTAKSKGQDVTQEQNQLNEIKSLLSDAATQSNAANKLLDQLTVTNVSTRTQTIAALNTDCKAERADLVKAAADRKAILAELKGQTSPSTTPTSTATDTTSAS